MARKPTPTPQVKESAGAPGVLEANTAAANQLAVAQLAQNERVTALAQQLNYRGSVDPAALENSARDALRRIGLAVFELGAYFLLLKEACPHGQFLPLLERLNFSPRVAQQYMNVTRRFADAKSTSYLEGAGITKLVELVALDDEQLGELTELGQTGELALDDVATMSVKQLRAAVRKERAEAAKQQRRAERQEAVNAELHEEVRLIKSKPAAEQVKRLVAEAATVQAETLGMVQGALRNALTQLQSSEQDQSLLMAGMVGQLIAELVGLRDEFNLPEVGATPEWESWAEANPGQAAKG